MRLRARGRWLAFPTLPAGALLLLAAACSSDPAGPAAPAEPLAIVPMVVSAAVAPNPHNAISAVVRVDARDATRARVEIAGGPDPAQATPEFPLAGGPAELPVLGLHPRTDYSFRIVVTSSTGDSAASDPLTFRTGDLPASIAAFEVTSPGTPEAGFTLLSPILNHPPVIVDRTGRVVWYRETPGSVVDFQLQPNGNFTAAVEELLPPPPFRGATYEEWDVLGRLLHTWQTPGYVTDLHEIRLLGDGAEALLIGFEVDTLDLTAFGVAGEDVVVGNVLQRVTRGGSVLFEWSSFDHYELAEVLEFVWTSREPAGYDVTHANAVELDRDGNYLLSTRHLSEITKIDASNGDIVWRMGKGSANEFTFVGDPHDGFHMMHSVRRLPNGNLLLIDNGNFHAAPSSRAVEYAVDEQARTATLVWSFEPGVFSCCMGFAQRLPGGNTLVNLGTDSQVYEVSPEGTVVWELRVADRKDLFGIYRASRIPSLYGFP